MIVGGVIVDRLGHNADRRCVMGDHRRENVRAAWILRRVDAVVVMVIRLTGGQNLRHESDVRDSQPQRFDA